MDNSTLNQTFTCGQNLSSILNDQDIVQQIITNTNDVHIENYKFLLITTTICFMILIVITLNIIF